MEDDSDPDHEFDLKGRSKSAAKPARIETSEKQEVITSRT
jgi:hypothetical protein